MIGSAEIFQKRIFFEYAEEMRKCLDKIFNLAIDERLK